MPMTAKSTSNPDTMRMPRGVRLIVLCSLLTLLAGAAYLFAVRGTAILLDLSLLSNYFLCI
jgi:hypothetical protein